MCSRSSAAQADSARYARSRLHAATKRAHSASRGRTAKSATASSLTTRPGPRGASRSASLTICPAGLSARCLKDAHRVGGLPPSHRFSGQIDMNAALGDLAEGQASNTTTGEFVQQRGPVPRLTEVPPQRPHPNLPGGIDDRDEMAQRVSVTCEPERRPLVPFVGWQLGSYISRQFGSSVVRPADRVVGPHRALFPMSPPVTR
jgi:hypothetical protein